MRCVFLEQDGSECHNLTVADYLPLCPIHAGFILEHELAQPKPDWLDALEIVVVDDQAIDEAKKKAYWEKANKVAVVAGVVGLIDPMIDLIRWLYLNLSKLGVWEGFMGFITPGGSPLSPPVKRRRKTKRRRDNFVRQRNNQKAAREREKLIELSALQSAKSETEIRQWCQQYLAGVFESQLELRALNRNLRAQSAREHNARREHEKEAGRIVRMAAASPLPDSPEGLAAARFSSWFAHLSADKNVAPKLVAPAALRSSLKLMAGRALLGHDSESTADQLQALLAILLRKNLDGMLKQDTISLIRELAPNEDWWEFHRMTTGQL